MSTPGEKVLVGGSVWSRLYHGETHVDFIKRTRLWFTISMIAVVIGLISLFTRGLNLGIDFEGGEVWDVPAGDASVSDARDALDSLGLGGATIQTLDSDEGTLIRVETESLDQEDSDQVTATLAELTGSSVDEVNLNAVGPSWGEQISEKAIRALVVFLVLVTIYITLRFEMKMALPTLVALIHDVLITVGVYSLTQFEVTPATVIAILTILGYSIYDGIVVFDKVDENTRMVSSTGGMTYGSMVNLSLNQALMRSLNTSLTALLPVGSLLVIGSWVLGAATLEEFALALLIGLFSGAYSSIFIASPLLAVLKEREPRYRDIRRRVETRRGKDAATALKAKRTKAPAPVVDDDVSDVADATPSDRARQAEAEPDAGGGRDRVVTTSGRVIPARPRKKTKGRRR
jgi:preprotein translocase subunit SecF